MTGAMLTVDLMQRERGVKERGEREHIPIKEDGIYLSLSFSSFLLNTHSSSKNHLTGCPASFLEESCETLDKAEWSEIISVEGGRETASCLMVSLMF